MTEAPLLSIILPPPKMLGKQLSEALKQGPGREELTPSLLILKLSELGNGTFSPQGLRDCVKAACADYLLVCEELPFTLQIEASVDEYVTALVGPDNPQFLEEALKEPKA